LKFAIGDLKFADRIGFYGKAFFLGKQKDKKRQKEQKRVFGITKSFIAMARDTRERPLLFELLRSLLPITFMGRAMLAALLIWFIDWVFVRGETLFGSSLLKKLCDYASLLGLIPLAYFAIKGAQWVTEHLLWRLRRRLIVTYLLIGALPILLLLSLIVMAGYVVVLQASESLVSRHLDGYLEQSRAVSRSLARDLAGWDIGGSDREQLRRRLQERADALSLVFPDLTLSLSSPGLNVFAINVGRASPEGAGPVVARVAS
jgi:hypothetical protein